MCHKVLSSPLSISLYIPMRFFLVQSKQINVRDRFSKFLETINFCTTFTFADISFIGQRMKMKMEKKTITTNKSKIFNLNRNDKYTTEIKELDTSFQFKTNSFDGILLFHYFTVHIHTNTYFASSTNRITNCIWNDKIKCKIESGTNEQKLFNTFFNIFWWHDAVHMIHEHIESLSFFVSFLFSVNNLYLMNIMQYTIKENDSIKRRWRWERKKNTKIRSIEFITRY